MEITHEPWTWPTGDKAWDICRAIAMAEGANIKGDVPDRLNNPGDISDGSHTFPFEHHSGSDVTHFFDKKTGWEWLHNKIWRIKNGISHNYKPTFTWTQIAHEWAGDSQDWLNNITRELKVKPTDIFEDYFNG